jgi:hypothetical protein
MRDTGSFFFSPVWRTLLNTRASLAILSPGYLHYLGRLVAAPFLFSFWTLASFTVLRGLTQKALQDRTIISHFGGLLAGRLQ